MTLSLRMLQKSDHFITQIVIVCYLSTATNNEYRPVQVTKAEVTSDFVAGITVVLCLIFHFGGDFMIYFYAEIYSKFK